MTTRDRGIWTIFVALGAGPSVGAVVFALQLAAANGEWSAFPFWLFLALPFAYGVGVLPALISGLIMLPIVYKVERRAVRLVVGGLVGGTVFGTVMLVYGGALSPHASESAHYVALNTTRRVLGKAITLGAVSGFVCTAIVEIMDYLGVERRPSGDGAPDISRTDP